MWSKLIVQQARLPLCSAFLQPTPKLVPLKRFQSVSQQNEAAASTRIIFPRQHEWNRAVAVAERLVGFPTSLMHVQALMNDEVSAMVTHMRKLMGSDHPVLRTLKRLIFHEGKNNLQVRGLIILLLARAANQGLTDLEELDPDTGVTARQRRLAEILEMILAAQAIHKSVLNLPHDLHQEPDEILRDDLLQLEYGNKIAILGGDYLLANACTGLADLRNTYIVEMISIAIAEFTQAEFLGQRDIQGRLIPTKDTITLEGWLQRNTLAYGSMLGNGCKSAMLLTNQPEEVQNRALRVGRNSALAIQAYTELQPFSEDMTSSSNFKGLLDLSAAPILFHLQNDPELLKYIQNCQEDVESLNSKQIYDAVARGPGVGMAKELCRRHALEALKDIDCINDGDAKSALHKIVSFLNV